MTNNYEDPKVGDKVKFNKVTVFWFTDIKENAKKLKKGLTYTIKSVRVYSSWICVTLEEVEGDFAYHFFKKA